MGLEIILFCIVSGIQELACIAGFVWGLVTILPRTVARAISEAVRERIAAGRLQRRLRRGVITLDELGRIAREIEKRRAKA